jgi:hypothetical protein
MPSDRRTTWLPAAASLAAALLACGEASAFGREELSYRVSWWVLHAGDLVLAVETGARYREREAVHLSYTVRSTGLAGKLFHVDDRIDSYVDPATRCSIAVEKRLQEGKRSEHTLVETGAMQLGCVQDILSAVYAIRFHDPMVPGGSFEVTTFDRGELYQMPVSVLRKETLTIGLGRYPSIVLEPQPRLGGAFQKKGRMTIWIEDAPSRLPLLVKSRVAVGSFTAELRSTRR